MNSKIQQILKKVSNPYVIIVSLIMVIFIMTIFITIMFPHFSEITVGGTILDVRFGYTPEQAYEIVKNYGQAGRSYYRNIQLLDLLSPIAHGMALMTMIYFFFSRAYIDRKWVPYLVLFPVFMVLFDYAENFGIYLMLRTYPETFEKIAAVTVIMTAMKAILWLLSVLLVLVGLVSLAIRKVFTP